MRNIRKLYERTWAIEDGGVRIFLIEGDEKALVIDTGMSGLDIHKIASEVTGRPLILLNTHADPDHTAGNAGFESFYMHPSEAMVYHNIFHKAGRVVPVYEGDEIDLGGRRMTVIHVPGHTPGSITVLDKEHRCLIGGDPVQEDGDIYMFGLHRDMQAYIFGLSHLLSFGADFDWVYPSHAKEKVGKDVIQKLIEAAEKILAGMVEGTPKELHGARILSYDAGICRFLCDIDICQ